MQRAFLPKKIVVLGAGCAGLATAMRLSKDGYDVEIFEQSGRVGGLAGGVEINGNVYEYGPHAFHTTDLEILNDIKSIMGDDFIEYKRTIKIKFLGNYFSYPLTIREVIFKLPLFTVIHAFLSLIWHALKGFVVKPKEENSETVLIRYYGKVLYKLFFEDFILRVWGIPASGFSPSFARERIPRLDIIKIVKILTAPMRRKINKNINTKNYVEEVEGNLYTTKKGFSLITERMAEACQKNGARIHLNSRVVGIDRYKNSIQSVTIADKNQNKRTVASDGVINTLPINEFFLMMNPPADPAVVSAAQQLKFRALVFVGLVVNRPKVLMTSFMYFRDHSFNRITDLSQFGFEINPSGSTILVAEISCGVDDRYWADEQFAMEQVILDLEREQILKKDEILHTHVFRAKHAYPIYALHYEKALETLLNHVSKSENYETAGRQGRFQYINTHIAMKMGYEAANRLTSKLKQAQVPMGVIHG